MLSRELFFIEVGICSANRRFAEYEGDCNFKMLLTFCTVCILFRSRSLNESQILDIVATTKCSSNAETFLSLAIGFLDI